MYVFKAIIKFCTPIKYWFFENSKDFNEGIYNEMLSLSPSG